KAKLEVLEVEQLRDGVGVDLMRQAGDVNARGGKGANKPMAGGGAMPAPRFGVNNGNNNGNNQGFGRMQGGFGGQPPMGMAPRGGFGAGGRGLGGPEAAKRPADAERQLGGFGNMARDQMIDRAAGLRKRANLQLRAESVVLPPLIVREYAHVLAHGADPN